MTKEIKLIKGDLTCDDRGIISFVNDFNFAGVKRFYQIQNVSKKIIRAFHGHQQEGKYVYVSQGSAKIICARMEEGKLLPPPSVFILSSKKTSILHIPPGFANGFKALEENTTLVFFSTSSLENSKRDDFRFAWDYFGKDIWETENR